MYTKFHQNRRGKGLTHWVIWHEMTQVLNWCKAIETHPYQQATELLVCLQNYK